MLKELTSNSRLRVWLAIVGSGTLIIGTAYVIVQQSTRLSADDLPLQVGQIIEHQLDSQSSPAPQSLVPTVKTDLRNDSTVFSTITDRNKKILASSASLDSQPTLPPQGTFDFTAKHGTDRFSWEPVNGVRQATRILTYQHGYIVTGQSLRPYEDKVKTYGLLAIAGWLAMAIWSYILVMLPGKKSL